MLFCKLSTHGLGTTIPTQSLTSFPHSEQNRTKMQNQTNFAKQVQREDVRKQFHASRMVSLETQQQEKKAPVVAKPNPKGGWASRRMQQNKQKESGQIALKSLDSEEMFPSLGGVKKEVSSTKQGAWGQIDEAAAKLERERREKLQQEAAAAAPPVVEAAPTTGGAWKPRIMRDR